MAGVAAAIVGVAGWYFYDRTGPRDAVAAREQLRADMQTLASELGFREVSPAAFDGPSSAGEECGIWQGDQQITKGPHRQHQISLEALPARGRAVTELGPDAKRILRRLGYRIITDDVDFVTPPPDGLVIATWGWGDVVEITLWPQPGSGTVRISGRAGCLPVSRR